MKIVIEDGRRYVLRFDKGEELFAGLSEFVLSKNITSAVFNAIGTASEVELGYFNAFLKDYRKKPFVENIEIVSLIGNCGTMAGKPAIHAHGSFSRTDFNVFAGHVFKLVTLATCEVFLIKLEGKMERSNNAEFNLNLLS